MNLYEKEQIHQWEPIKVRLYKESASVSVGFYGVQTTTHEMVDGFK